IAHIAIIVCTRGSELNSQVLMKPQSLGLRLRLLRQRQCNNERGAMPRSIACGAYGAAMEFDELAHQRQAQAQSRVAPSTRGVGLREPGKNVGQKIRRYPFTGVLHLDSYPGVFVTQVDRETPALRGEFYCIAQQIPNDLSQPILVS